MGAVSSDGQGVPCDYYPWCIGPHCAGPLGPTRHWNPWRCSCLRHGTLGHTSRGPALCYWHLVVKTGEVTAMVGASGQYASYLNAFLLAKYFQNSSVYSSNEDFFLILKECRGTFRLKSSIKRFRRGLEWKSDYYSCFLIKMWMIRDLLNGSFSGLTLPCRRSFTGHDLFRLMICREPQRNYYTTNFGDTNSKGLTSRRRSISSSCLPVD